MKKLRAPYNFVPLNETVVFPEWANQISQDVPFSDAISGTLELKVSAETDIFVRNGHTRAEADEQHDRYVSFSKTADGRFFIPGTSLKGAVRNVLEILSMGKMQHVINRHFGIRDLNDKQFYIQKIKADGIRCGWLYRKENGWCLTDCGKPWRIAAEELDRHFNTSLLSFIRTGDFTDDRNRMALAKYRIFASCGPLTGIFKNCGWKKNSLQVVHFVRDHGTPGHIVFTGQNSGGDGQNVKVYEFVFPDDPNQTKEITVPEAVFQEFDSVHQTSLDYVDYWSQKLEAGERVPVFFTYKAHDELDAMGLAFMFRYPAFHSVHDAIPDELLSRRPDLASCIFGFSNEYKSLRGRVQFGHVFAEGIPEERSICSISMASPKPSFYPFYLGNGKTWNSQGDVRIAGRKRYPVRSTLESFRVATANMEGKMRPLASGTVFKGYIHFHNLRRVELGALYSALTFHEHFECAHQLGAAKPFGYGKVRFKVQIKDADSKCDLTELMKEFESWMIGKKSDWLYSRELKELFAMAEGIPKEKEKDFTYMEMSTTGTNEFVDAKKAYCKEGMQLGSFSQIKESKVPKVFLWPQIPPTGKVKRKDKEQRLKEEVKILKEKDEQEIRNEFLYRAIEYAWEHEDYPEYLKKVSEVKNNARKQQWEEQWKQRNNECCAYVRELQDIADKLKENRQYKEALGQYKIIQQKTDDLKRQGFSCFCNVGPYMVECEQKIAEVERRSSMRFDEFLNTLKMDSSLPALGNNLKKWIQEHGDLSDSDVQMLAERICLEKDGCSEKEIRNYFSKSNCQKFEKNVGRRIAEMVYARFT